VSEAGASRSPAPLGNAAESRIRCAPLPRSKSDCKADSATLRRAIPAFRTPSDARPLPQLCRGRARPRSLTRGWPKAGWGVSRRGDAGRVAKRTVQTCTGPSPLSAPHPAPITLRKNGRSSERPMAPSLSSRRPGRRGAGRIQTMNHCHPCIRSILSPIYPLDTPPSAACNTAFTHFERRPFPFRSLAGERSAIARRKTGVVRLPSWERGRIPSPSGLDPGVARSAG
jgi:hypothetical protein